MKKIIFLLVIGLLLVSCADVENVKTCVTGDPCGFWYGLLHGIIAPISFIVSLFDDSVAVYALNNNGGWYDFGFLLGVGAFTTTTTSSTKKRR